MLFSIIVPIYNVEQYIHRCVGSLIRQTYTDIEIILVDDGSPDACPEICDTYAKIDMRIRVVHKKNGGLSDARNKGLEYATGEYVMFVDADDYIEPQACERLADFVKDGTDIIIGDAFIHGGNIDLSHIQDMKEVCSGEEYLLKACKQGKTPMEVWLNVYRRLFLLQNDLFFKYGILHEDEQFTPRAFLKANTVKCSNVDFYHYVIRERSITTKKDKRRNIIDFYDTCMELEQIYNDLENESLKKYLLNVLCEKYLSLFQSGQLYKYGNQFVHKEFIRRNVFLKKTKMKGLLFRINPTLYYWINNFSKVICRRTEDSGNK